MSDPDFTIGHSNKLAAINNLCNQYNDKVGISPKSKGSAQSILRQKLGVSGALPNIQSSSFEAAIRIVTLMIDEAAPGLTCACCGKRDEEHEFFSWVMCRPCASKRGQTASNKYARKRRATDPVFMMACRVRNRTRKAIRSMGFSKSSSTAVILGCDWDQFKRHIELQFLPGMSWENTPEWHIDHIVPLASANDVEEVIALSHFTNLQPLWAKDNLRKSDKITRLI